MDTHIIHTYCWKCQYKPLDLQELSYDGLCFYCEDSLSPPTGRKTEE